MITPLENWSVIKVSGENAATFLQGQLTCDVNQVTPPQGRLGALCNHQGRVLAVLSLFKEDQDYYCVMPDCISENFSQHLQKFAVFSKVTLEDVTVDYQVSAQIPEASDQEHIIKLAPSLSDASIWKAALVTSGMPFIYADTIATVTPHMLNLHDLDAISFTKGCYVGQEIIARTQYLGKSKRHLYCAKILENSNDIKIGATLKMGEQDVGILIEVVRQEQGALVLAVIQDAAATESIHCAGMQLTEVFCSAPLAALPQLIFSRLA